MKNKFLFSVFVYFFILIFLSLGVWQIVRLNWKLNLISEIEENINSKPVFFSGNNPHNFKKIEFEANFDNSKLSSLLPGVKNLIMVGKKMKEQDFFVKFFFDNLTLPSY